MCLLRRGDHFTHGKTLDGTLSEALPILFESFLFISQLLRLGNCQWSRENQRKQRPPKKERRKRTKDMFQTVENNQNKVRNKEQTKKKKSKIRFKNKKTTLEFIAFLCAAFPPAFLVSWGFSSTCQYYFVVIIIHYCSTWVWSNKFQVRDSPTVKGNEKKGPWVFGEFFVSLSFLETQRGVAIICVCWERGRGGGIETEKKGISNKSGVLL